MTAGVMLFGAMGAVALDPAPGAGGSEGVSLELQAVYGQAVEALSRAQEKRDPYTCSHQRRVADLAVAIGREMRLPAGQLEGVRLGALIHDIGKIYVPAEILTRTGHLLPQELALIQAHPRVGYEIVKDVSFPWPIAEMVLQHHERLDGSGYPDGLARHAIVPEARLLAVADVVEAMASFRPYRPALGVETALAEIESGRGKRYEPEVVDACLRIFREGRFTLPAT